MSVRARASVVPWWLFLVTGIAWLLISLIVLRFDVTSIAAVGALLGVIFLMAGANEFVIAFAQPSWRWAHAVLGILFVGGGLWAFVHPLAWCGSGSRRYSAGSTRSSSRSRFEG